MHRALASAVTDVEERARHLALAAEGPDAAIASELDAAAEHAVARGAPTAAAELCELAAELTPADPAPRSESAHAGSQLPSPRRERRAGGRDVRAAARRGSAGRRAGRRPLRARSTERARQPAPVELCDEALAEAPGDDARSARILAFRSGALLRTGEGVRTALSDARAALAEGRASRRACPARRRDRTAGDRGGWTRARVTPGLLERGVEIEERLGLELEYYDSPRYALGRQLMRLGTRTGARAILEELETEAVATRGRVHRAASSSGG